MPATATVLVVDDEPDIRDAVRDVLGDAGYGVVLAANAVEAREARRERRPDLVLLDVWMPGTDGISLLREWVERGALPCPVVMMSGHGTIETAVEATRLGAWDFIEKPISMAKLLLAAQRALESGALKRENEGLRRALPSVNEPIGSSRAAQALRQQLERLANADAPVLIQGEAGTGKESLARQLHQRGARRQGPFVRVAAASLPRESASPLSFGHEAGDGVHYGFLDQAQGGTLFLDGLTEFEPELQRQLAAAFESRSYVRRGGSRPVALDVRVIGALGGDADVALREGRLLPELYYQLAVLPLVVPPLRERADDIPELLEQHADAIALRDGIAYRRFSIAAQNRLRQHPWPGNLRELRNLVQRLLILGGGDIDLAEVEQVLGLATTPLPLPSGAFSLDLSLPLREARDAFERAYLGQLLKQAEGSVGRLAIMAGMERTHLYRKLRDLGIDLRSERGAQA
jgi:DNA-binding NtrC family response regulator